MNFFLDVTSMENIEELLQRHSPSELLDYSIRSLKLFMLSNFAGLKGSIESIIGKISSTYRQALLEELSFDLNCPHKKVRYIELLWIAQKLLFNMDETIENADILLWKFRTLFSWALILDEPSIQLQERIKPLLNSVQVSIEGKYPNYVTSEWLLERMYFHLFFYEYDDAKNCLSKVISLASLNLDLIGLLGKRTRFQQKELAQLVVSANSMNLNEEFEKDTDVPMNCMLNDDTLLEHVTLVNDDLKRTNLSPIQLGCLLATAILEKRTHHHDEILKERLLSYLDEIITQRHNFALQIRALAERCELEKGQRRRVDRACRQIEVLTKLLDDIDDSVNDEAKLKRFNMLLASNPIPYWKMHDIHAKILRSLGCTGEALRIYEAMEDWDQVVECYKHLEQLEKAEQLVKKLLHEKEDPIYYCLLGDITRNAEYYEKAIAISKDRSARARKALGNLMLIRNQFDQAYVHLKRSVEIQPIQLGTWFNAGHCAWKLDHYQDAAAAYHRCVTLEPEHFEAWNNLAAAYIRLNQKQRAQKILQEALKFNYDHANIWENYLLICVDVADFSQAIEAYHRCMDLKHRFADDQVLEIIVTQILKSSEGENENRMKEHMKKLLGRISSTQSTSSNFWHLYAKSKKPAEDSTDRIAWDVYFDLEDKSLRLLLNEKNWEKDEEKAIKILEKAIILANERRSFSLNVESEGAMLSSKIRMSLRPLLSLLEKIYGLDCNEACSLLQEKYKTGKDLLKSL